MSSEPGEGAAPPSPPSQAPPKGRTLAVNSSGVFLISLVIQFAGYIPTFFFAREIGLNDAGKALLGTIQTFLLAATSVSNLGDLRIGAAYTFFVSRGQPPRDSTVTYLLIRFAMVGLAGIVLWAIAPSLGISVGAAIPIFAVWMTFPLLWSLSNVYQGLHVSLGDSLRGQFPLLVESIVRSSALVAVALYLAGLPPASGTLGALADPANTMWVMTGAYAIGAIASAAVSLPAILRVRGPFHRPTATRMFRWSLPLMGSMVLLYLSGNLISILVVAFLNTRDFNIFNTANAFRILALSLPVAIAVPLFPHLSSLHQAEAFEVIRSRTWQSLRYTAILVVPVALSFGIYRSNLLNIFYQVTYVALASTPLGLLAASAIPAALSQIIGTSLTSVGRTRLELYITSVQVAALGGLCFALVGPLPPFEGLVPYGVTGLNGAAIAVLASSLAALALNTYFLGTVLGVRIQLRPIGTILLAASASFFAVSRINEVLPINRYYQLAFGVLVGFLVYGAVLALTGELSKEDVDQVIRSLGLPKALGRFLASFCWRDASWPVNPMPAGGAEALVPGGGIDLGERSDGRVEPPSPPP